MLMGKARVYDGDSIFFGKVEVRIDAPEINQACKNKENRFWPCGIAARDALRQMAGDDEVQCAISGRDKYRRLLGVCYAGNRDLNAAMVESGQAIAYHHFSERYAREELQAKAAGRGIWQDASFTEPYFCRHPHDGHTCYEYDFALGEGRMAESSMMEKSHAAGIPN